MAKKKEVTYWVEFSQLNARDTNIFIAEELAFEDNGYVKMVGHYKRKKNKIVLYIPNSTIISIEEVEGSAEEAETAETEEKV